MQCDNSHRLLERTALLYEKYEVGNRDTFNVFSVLRTESDEVNLHSRFLAALLDHRKSRDEPQQNLKDFLRSVARVNNFDLDGAEVEREHLNIDILILNRRSRQSVVIENKIWARDQPRQLARYAGQMENDGYYRPHLLYLTLDGHDPGKNSADGHESTCVSYKDDLVPWLERCQKRAYDEPALRETVAQYVRLVRKLTGTDIGGVYMNELSKLILENNNLVLVHDLNEAMVDAKVSLLEKLWKDIDCKLRECVRDLPGKNDKSDISPEKIRNFVVSKQKRVYHGLYYGFTKGASLGVEVEDRICFGVACTKDDHEAEYSKLKAALEGRAPSSDWWPWYQWAPGNLNLRRPTRENLELLADSRARQKFAEGVADGLSNVWNRVRRAGLAESSPGT